jgi:hypothetical protein
VQKVYLSVIRKGDFAGRFPVGQIMDRLRRTPSGFRPTDTVALSTAQRLGLYQQVRQHSLRITVLGFLMLAVGGVFAGLLLQGSACAVADRSICVFLLVGLGGSGLILLWMRRYCRPVLVALWCMALVASVVAAIARF